MIDRYNDSKKFSDNKDEIPKIPEFPKCRVIKDNQIGDCPLCSFSTHRKNLIGNWYCHNDECKHSTYPIYFKHFRIHEYKSNHIHRFIIQVKRFGMWKNFKKTKWFKRNYVYFKDNYRIYYMYRSLDDAKNTIKLIKNRLLVISKDNTYIIEIDKYHTNI